MKFLPVQDFDIINSALNFDTVDCHVVGACELYTTKAASSDKKLYKNIENALESQHASLVQLSASLSPPQASSAAESLNLSRSSPFGPLSQISSRRTFAYLIATLNAAHQDYEFSRILRPTDFRRERNLKSALNLIDTTLSNLRPRATASRAQLDNLNESYAASSSSTNQVWGPKMWSLIDKEMDLRECAVYCYDPEEDPFDGEEGAIWTMSYFFFNKVKKRVCYIYIRGLSVASHSPVQTTPVKVFRTATASKRADYWLGDRARAVGTEDEDEDDLSHVEWNEDEDYEDQSDAYEKDKLPVRGISEEIVATLEV